VERLFARAFSFFLGAAALCWGTLTLPIFWNEAEIATTSDHIVQGHLYASSVLDRELSAARSSNAGFCRAPALRNTAILRFSLVENALADGIRTRLDERLAELKQNSQELFSCDPTGSFFWLVFYWTKVNIDGFQPDLLKFLRMSYQQGPNEGWIATKRNRLALAIFAELPPDLARSATDEFVGIVRSGFIEDAAAILTGPGWPFRFELLAQLDTVGLAERERLAIHLRDSGHESPIPGVVLPRKSFY
jgi:hypothetical protein